MQQYSILQGLYLSFFGRSFYQDVAKNWKGLGLRYLLLVLLINSAAIGLFLALIWWTFLSSSDGINIIHQWPNFRVTDGKLSLGGNSPCTVIDPKTKEKLIVFDTEHKFKSCGDAGSIWLLTKSAIYVKDSNKIKTSTKPVLTYSSLSPYFNNITATPETILITMRQLMFWIAFGGSVLCFVSEFILDTLRSVFWSWIFGLCGSKHSFAARMRLLIVSYTPATFVSMMSLWLFRFQFGGIRSCLVDILLLLYMYLAFKWARSVQATS